MKKELIFGKDNTEKVVSIDVKDGKLYIYKVINGKIEVESRNNKFWLISNKKLLNSNSLEGNSYYKHIKEFTDRWQYLKYRKAKHADIWSIYNQQESALIKEGITYFKGMKVEDLSVLAFDIEGTGLSFDDNSKVLLISNTFKKNGKIIKKLFCYDNYVNEADMFDDWCKWIREIDPSVIVAHNIFGYDLPYMSHCAVKAGTKLWLGRDGGPVRFNTYPSKFRKDGSQQYDFCDIIIAGREIIDTFFLSIKYDIGRNFESYKLKTIIKHLGLEKQDRQHYDASKIAKNYTIPSEWEKIKKYAADDADDALALYELMIPPFFYLSQSVPRTFQQIINTASGAQLNALMIRAYLQENHSLPKASEAQSYEGAISMGIPGIYKNVKKVDVASLYPSIMLHHQVFDFKKDPKGYMIEMLNYFTEERLKNKKLAKETGNKYYNHLEQSGKLFINSAYGFLGTPGLLFNSPEKAAFITRKGREILLKGVEWATGYRLKQIYRNAEKLDKGMEWILGDKVSEGKGYQLVNVDTDSFSYTNEKVFTEENFHKEIEELNSLYPDKIKWEDDGYYDKLLVIKTKNYVLKKGNKIKYKGSSITDKKKEVALLEMLYKLIDSLLEERNDIEEIYKSYVKEAWNIKDINRWVTKKTITKSVLNPERTNEQKVKDAITEEFVNEGDKVWLYSAIDGEVQKMEKRQPVIYKKTGLPKMVPNKVLKFPEQWNGDEDKLHYVKRVYNTVMILSNIIDTSKIIKYFNKTNQKLLDKL